MKLKIKRIVRFIRHGGLKYLSAQGVAGALLWSLSNRLKPAANKIIYWIGPFSPIHANVGDHAQTLGVRFFLRDKFSDYRIVRVYRDDITPDKLARIGSRVRERDMVFLHSSGDFGSKHDMPGHHPGRLSYPEVRRRLVALAPARKIINLPTTVYYEETQAGLGSLHKDREAFDNSSLTVLCREEESLRAVREKLACNSRFFPDFVFYLKPEPRATQRKGALVILRSDKEAALPEARKQELIRSLGKSFEDVEVNDILNSRHTIPDYILEKYMDGVFQKYQARELIVTDKMHGMIIAVITRTPCVAINGGIPHKIRAYRSFLAGAVEFVDEAAEIENAVQRIRGREYAPVDLSGYYERFRSEVAGV